MHVSRLRLIQNMHEYILYPGSEHCLFVANYWNPCSHVKLFLFWEVKSTHTLPPPPHVVLLISTNTHQIPTFCCVIHYWIQVFFIFMSQQGRRERKWSSPWGNSFETWLFTMLIFMQLRKSTYWIWKGFKTSIKMR